MKVAKTHGLCPMHYQRWRKWGDTGCTKKGGRREQPLFERFWSKVDKGGPNGCWIWTGGFFEAGYGSFWVKEKGQNVTAHRFAYETIIGPVPEGMELDHLCRNRACLNPAHLEPVTCRTNLLRGNTWAAQNSKKTFCKHGHAFDEKNTAIDKLGKRVCRACAAERSNRYREKMKASTV